MSQEQYDCEVMAELWFSEQQLTPDHESKKRSETKSDAEKREHERQIIEMLIKEESTDEFDRERYGWW